MEDTKFSDKKYFSVITALQEPDHLICTNIYASTKFYK